MIGIHNRLRALRANDGGFTMVEVLVAMMLFTIVSVSIVGSLIAIRTISASANLRQTAQNLAAGALDKARTVTDITTLNGGTTTQTVGNRTFTLTESVAWVGSIIGSASQCSSGSGNMIARSVTVSVTWNGMGGQNPVTMSTVVAPDTRLNTAGNGAILVSVRAASGAGLAGVTAKAKPAAANPNGASTTAGPFTTDADGCVFIPGVTPGNYDVTISMAAAGNAYVGSDQTASPLTDTGVTVSASNSASAPFQLDQSMKYALHLGANLPAKKLPSSPTLLPSFTNTYGIWTPGGSGPTYLAGGATGPYFLHPYSAGYRIVAGILGANGDTAPSCAAVDPANWPSASDPNDATQTLSSPDLTSEATPGGSKAVDVPMGGVTVTGYSGTITAFGVAAEPTDNPDPTAVSVDPTCASPTNYRFDSVTDGSVLALPYGYWQLRAGTSTTSPLIPEGDLAVDGASRVDDYDPSSLVVVLDPRVPTPAAGEPAP
jgi:prepilin-type N-terminal cleavage/methylation domain-containing protein